MIAADVRWKGKHLAREASPTRKLATLSLIYWQLNGCKDRTSEIFDNGWSAFKILEPETSGKLAILFRIRLEDGHNSTLHFIECHSVKFPPSV